jgi:hypothetical protein
MSWGEIYNTSWWGIALDTARTVKARPDFFGSQLNLLTSEQPNLVTNGTFDTDSNWSNFSTPTTSEQSTNKAYLGNYSWYVVANAFRQGIFSPNNFSLVNGKKYKVSLWVYAVDGNEILSGVSNSDASVFTSRTVAQGQWTNIVYYFTATATSASYISILSSSSTLEFYVDNVSVQVARAELDQIEAKKCLADWIHTTALKDLNN